MKTDLKKAIIYQIYPRNFTQEGTIKEAEKMIPHIADLGIDIIYMSACNVEETSEEGQSRRQLASGMSNVKNPYRITDYFEVDEEYGSMSDLKDFVYTAHKYGLKVLIDLVYLHCGVNGVFLKEHPEMVVRDESGGIKLGADWPFARFNYNESATREYLWSNMEFYISEVKADGFRCDVGDWVPLDFWQEGVRRIKEINPDVIMLNEGQNTEYFSAFDIGYNFSQTHSINNTFLNPKNSGKNIRRQHLTTDEDFDAKELKRVIATMNDSLPESKYWLSSAENHDIASDLENERIEMHLGNDAVCAVLALVFTLKGVPMLFNGCEVADAAEKSMFWNRFCSGSKAVQWQNALTKKGQDRLAFVKQCIKLHKRDEISIGELLWIDSGNEKNVLCFERKYGESSIVVAVNVTAREQLVKIGRCRKALISRNTELVSEKVKLKAYGFIIAER